MSVGLTETLYRSNITQYLCDQFFILYLVKLDLIIALTSVNLNDPSYKKFDSLRWHLDME